MRLWLGLRDQGSSAVRMLELVACLLAQTWMIKIVVTNGKGQPHKHLHSFPFPFILVVEGQAVQWTPTAVQPRFSLVTTWAFNANNNLAIFLSII